MSAADRLARPCPEQAPSRGHEERQPDEEPESAESEDRHGLARRDAARHGGDGEQRPADGGQAVEGPRGDAGCDTGPGQARARATPSRRQQHGEDAVVQRPQRLDAAPARACRRRRRPRGPARQATSDGEQRQDAGAPTRPVYAQPGRGPASSRRKAPPRNGRQARCRPPRRWRRERT